MVIFYSYLRDGSVKKKWSSRMTGFCTCMGKWFQNLRLIFVVVIVSSWSSLKEVLAECKCSINSVSVKQRPWVVQNKACCVVKLKRKWRVHCNLVLMFIWQPSRLFLSWLVFCQSVHLYVDRLNSIYSIASWKCDALDCGRDLWYAIIKDRTQICSPFLSNP